MPSSFAKAWPIPVAVCSDMSTIRERREKEGDLRDLGHIEREERSSEQGQKLECDLDVGVQQDSRRTGYKDAAR